MRDSLETSITAKLLSMTDNVGYGMLPNSTNLSMSPVAAMGPRHVVVLGASLSYPVTVVPSRGTFQIY